MSTGVTWQQVGFFNKEINIESAIYNLESHVEKMANIFQGFSKEEVLHKTAPGKWSKQEILGHLIDSAINNLQRFTEIQFLPQPYRVLPYLQNELVAVNHYQSLPLLHLLDLWKALNKQIIYVVKNIPQEILDYPVDPQYNNDEIKNLGWIICDYVAHLEHHLKQLQ